MDKLRNNFELLYERLKCTTMFTSMAQTVEDSHWHREANVQVHTDMVVDEYIKSFADGHEWSEADMLGALACAFHDVGKPAAEITKAREDGSEYRQYGGHDQISARLFEDWAVTNTNMSATQIATVVWMVEYHMPWSLKKAHKRDGLIRTALFFDVVDQYKRFLWADQRGRISDDAEKKHAEVAEWFVGFDKDVERLRQTQRTWLEHEQKPPATGGRDFLMLIGTSGSGKSTIRDSMTQCTPAIFCMDDIRLEMYKPKPYGEAFYQSTIDPNFSPVVDKKFAELINSDAASVVSDNTNIKKSRRWSNIVDAVKAKRFPIAMYFTSSIAGLAERQEHRGDKKVPYDAVRRQFMSTQIPSLAEFEDMVFYRTMKPTAEQVVQVFE